VFLSGEPVGLTPLEYDVLAFFAANKGYVFSREDLLSNIWGYQNQSYETNVNSQISRLRKKIEPDPKRPIYIMTVRGVGYRCADVDE